MPVVWNDSERCAEFLVEELEITLFGAADVMIDAWFKVWGTDAWSIDVELGQKARFALGRSDPTHALIRNLAVAELLKNPRYAERLEECDELLDAANQSRYRRDVGYGHQQHELA